MTLVSIKHGKRTHGILHLTIRDTTVYGLKIVVSNEYSRSRVEEWIEHSMNKIKWRVPYARGENVP